MNQLKSISQNHPSERLLTSKKAFTLVEVIVGLWVFVTLTTVASVAMLQTQKTAHANVMHNSARTVVQGYMEQIKGIPFDVLNACVIDTTKPIPTKSVDTSASTDLIVDDDLFIGISNTKTIILDTIIKSDGSLKSQTMTLKLKPTILNIYSSMGRKLLEINLEYQYESTFSGITLNKSGSLRFVKTDVSEY